MDLRTKKTEQSLIDAYIDLRREKPIEKITVKELAEKAMMNKATFYRHYSDIYDLADAIENSFIEKCLATIPDTVEFPTYNDTYKLMHVFSEEKELFDIIFSGSRWDNAVHIIHNQICDRIFSHHPEYKDDKQKCILLTAMIYGCFHAYLMYRGKQPDFVIEELSKITKKAFE